MRGKKNAATKTSTRLRETANKWLSSHTLTHTHTHTHVVHADGLMKEETIARGRRERGREVDERVAGRLQQAMCNCNAYNRMWRGNEKSCMALPTLPTLPTSTHSERTVGHKAHLTKNNEEKFWHYLSV